MSVDEEYLDNLLKSVTSGDISDETPDEIQTLGEPKEDDMSNDDMLDIDAMLREFNMEMGMEEESTAKVPETADVSEADIIAEMLGTGAEGVQEETQESTTEEADSGLPDMTEIDGDDTDILDFSNLFPPDVSDGAEFSDGAELSDGADVSDGAELSDAADMEDNAEFFGIDEGMPADLLEEIREKAPEEQTGKKSREERAAEKQAKKLEKKEKKAAEKEDRKAQKEAKKLVQDAENEEEPKKAGFFGRLFEKLTEEDEETAPDSAEQNPEDGIKDKKDADKKKKGKKKKGSKEESDEDEDGTKKGGKDKKKVKPKKEKKQKPAKAAEETKPVKKVKKGSILVVFGFAASVLVAILMVNNILVPVLVRQGGRKAFEKKDYETCYQALSGWDLTAEESSMRQYAGVVMKLEKRIAFYEQYLSMHQETEAIDSLLKAVRNYAALYQEALNCGAEEEVDVIYSQILQLLADEYGLSADVAKIVAETESDIEYTRYLTAIAKGEDISGLLQSELIQENDGEISDFLPEEEELPDGNFMDGEE